MQATLPVSYTHLDVYKRQISIVSWLVTAVGSTALAYAFAQCGMFSRKSGGMGGYAEYSFGKAGN